MTDLVQYNHILVVADERDLKLFNLNQLDGFRYESINYSADLAKKRLISHAGPEAPKAIFIGIGSFDAVQKTPIDHFQDHLNTFFKNNRTAIGNANLVFLKPRIKSHMNDFEKMNLARYISTAYGCFLNADPECVLLTMDRKPRIVSLEYKKLFSNIIEGGSNKSGTTSVIVTKPATSYDDRRSADIHVTKTTNVNVTVEKSESSSDSTSTVESIEDIKKVEVEVVKKEVIVTNDNGDKQIIVNRTEISGVEEDRKNVVVTSSSESSDSDSDFPGGDSPTPPKPLNPESNIYDAVHNRSTTNSHSTSERLKSGRELTNPEGKYLLFFKGNDFVSECDIQIKQNGTVLPNKTEKYSKKEYGSDPYFIEPVAVSFDQNPLNQNLEIIFGKWGHLNVSMKQILANEIFKVHAVKKTVKTARVSITALRPQTAQTTIAFSGQNLKKMDTFGKTDPFFKVYVNSPNAKEDVLVYQSETVKNDDSPNFEKFTLYDGRYNTTTDTLIFEWFDEDTFSKSYMGNFEIDYKDLGTHFKNYNHAPLEILNAKQQLMGQVRAHIETTGVTPMLPSQRISTAESFRIYIKCENLEKESNQVTFDVEGNKSKTEKVSKCKSPAFTTAMELPNVSRMQDFTINFSNSTKKEDATVSFQDLIRRGLNEVTAHRFGDKGQVLYLQLVNTAEDPKWAIQVDADSVPVMDKHLEGSKADPYFKVFLDDFYYFTSPAAKQSLQCSIVFELPGLRVSHSRVMRLDWYDKDKVGSDDPIGTVQMSVESMMKNHAHRLGVRQMPGTKSAPKGLEQMSVSAGVKSYNA